MSIYKRGNTYWLDITTPSGERVRRSTGTEVKKKAQELHDKIKAELWDMAHLNKKPPKLFEEALLLFVEDAKLKKDLLAFCFWRVEVERYYRRKHYG